MAKLLPLRRRAVRAIASCGVILAVLLQALAVLVAEADRSPTRSDAAVLTDSAAQICRTADGDHAPPAGRHACDLCPLGPCEGDAAGSADAPAAAATTAPQRPAAAPHRAPDADAPPPPAGWASSWSSRAPPRA
jgi:hypothetical protein